MMVSDTSLVSYTKAKSLAVDVMTITWWVHEDANNKAAGGTTHEMQCRPFLHTRMFH